MACNDTYCDGINDAIQAQCKNEQDSCQVTLNEAFSFEWDNLYIFNEYFFPEDVSAIIGFDCECDVVPDAKRLVIFTKGGKAVKKIITECYDVSFVGMQLKTNGNVIKVHRDDEFVLQRRKVYNKVRYFLFPVE